MDRTSAANWTDIGGGKRGYRDRNLGAGLAGTALVAADRNAIQEELVRVIEAAGIAPAANDWTQLLSALNTLYAPEGSLGTTGWVRFRRGLMSAPLIMQWGLNTAGTAGAVTLPIAFPTRGVCVLAIDADSAPEVCGASFVGPAQRHADQPPRHRREFLAGDRVLRRQR